MENHHHDCTCDHHHHHHHHHDHKIVLKSLNYTFILCIVLNLLFVIVEAITGIIYGSMSLLSDAGHNLGDVFSLLLALFAFRIAKSNSTSKFTYGYKKGTILISLVNAIIILLAVGIIIYESISKLISPIEVSGAAISWVAAIGILINGVTTLLLMKSRNRDLNSRGAYLHMAMDTLVSIGVVISGICIMCTGWTIIDPIVSIIIALVIISSTWSLLRESVNLILDSVPSAINIAHIKTEILQLKGVENIHHIHVWAIGTEENAATLHIVIEDTEKLDEIRIEIKNKLKELGIQHSTVEVESHDATCSDESCC